MNVTSSLSSINISVSRRQILAAMAAMIPALVVHRTAIAARFRNGEQTGDFAGLVDIGGRSLWIDCRGSGNPTVVLEAGSGNNGMIWDNVALDPGVSGPAVLPGVAGFTHVCAYDRPGTVIGVDDPNDFSRSDPVPMPRTAAEMVADLHALLTAADEPPPYVLAGHSFGGLIVRLYACTYPDEVAGLVLVDSAHEDYWAAIKALMTPEQQAIAFAHPPTLTGGSEQEWIDVDACAAQMREAAAKSPLRPMPLIVLTRGIPPEWPAGFPAAEMEAIWLPLQKELAALVPDSRLMVAEKSSHYIQTGQPELVIESIRQVVDAVRDPGSWAS